MVQTLTYPASERFQIPLFRTSGLTVVINLASDACFRACSALGTLSITCISFVSSRPKTAVNKTERLGLDPMGMSSRPYASHLTALVGYGLNQQEIIRIGLLTSQFPLAALLAGASRLLS